MIPFDRGAVAYARQDLVVTTGAVVTLSTALLDNTAGLTGNPTPSGGVNPNYKRATVVRVAVNPPAGDINFTLDGTDPQTGAGIGENLSSEDAKPYLMLSYGLAKRLKMIAVTANSDVSVEYFA